MIAALSLAVIAGIFLLIYRLKQQRELFYWMLGWWLLAGHAALGALAVSTRVSFASPRILQASSHLLLALAAIFLFYSAQIFVHGSRRPTLYLAMGAVLVAWAIAPGIRLGTFQLSAPVGAGAVMILAAYTFWESGRRREVLGEVLLAASFLVWGVWLLSALARPAALASPPYNTVIGLVPLQLVAISMIMVQYEEERRRVERNMLALSNLNLVTSSFEPGITREEMLRQTLERVLGVLRVSHGAILLTDPETRAPGIFVCEGLRTRFFSELRNGLGPYFGDTIARLGGLVVFRDLHQNRVFAALERDAQFQRLRAAMRAESFQTVVGITLRAKHRDFGLMTLASPSSRRFSAAELRLLLALGSQVGLAMENFWLAQQSRRRAEELHILNEIGRAISSALERDELLRLIHSEMRKLIDVDNFFIVFLDPERNEVRFELEVKNGEVLPKRARPARNGLSEYILRTRQPLLIRENFDEAVARLGVTPGQRAKSFCAVPIVVYDRAVGVIGVHSDREGRGFDTGHLDMLKILAAQAAVAVENARLFAEEQKQTRLMTLLNNVSRKAISTLNPEEMLYEIAEEIRHGVSYDHVGIGVLDYATKEIVLQAEAGRRGEGRGRQIKLGEDVIGQVAASGETVLRNRLDGGAHESTILKDAAAVLCLPITYSDQLLGVLNIESAVPDVFGEDEAVGMRTLADLIASALHNAYMFQKAQEQAITDGLTSVKTHRFFMEALSAEWKRATRAGRYFSLVLIDLDKFKFVNDYFGHLEGDTVLRRVGQILEQGCRRSDVVARYGGDEFVILMPETNIEQARILAEKLREWIATDSLLAERQISASIGIATFPLHGATPQELIQVADASMYLAKHQGGNSVASAEQYATSEQREWQRHVLEAYLGVTIKRMFSTGPEAFEEIYKRLQQITSSFGENVTELPAPVIETVTSLAFAIDAKDHYTQGHSQSVSRYSVMLARGRGLPEGEVEEIRLAAILHDVGKIGIPERILHKPARLDPEEMEIMKNHAYLGAKILQPLRSITRIQAFVKHHHENYDGTGYPENLAGETIPLGARIIAIADAYDTLVSERTYKKALSKAEALGELRRCGGTQFDPQLVCIFEEALAREAPSVEEIRSPQ